MLYDEKDKNEVKEESFDHRSSRGDPVKWNFLDFSSDVNTSQTLLALFFSLFL
jgi:hypothetical protein